MGVKAIFSNKANVQEAISDLCSQAKSFNTRMVLYFASSAYEPHALADGMQKKFSGASVFGCSTSGELISGEMLKGSVVAMLFDPDVIADVCVEVVEKVAEANHIPDAFHKFEEYYRTPMTSLDITKYVGIILADGMSKSEEKLMEKIGDLTSVTFIGGSAGDDCKFQKTFVYANGKEYTDAAILALIKPTRGFDIIKTQSFFALDDVLEATEVDEPNRKVIQFNHKPALQAYAEALKVTPEASQKLFMKHPLGLISGTDIYVRSPQIAVGNDMVFFCNIRKGMQLHLLDNTDIISDSRKAVESKKAEMGSISGIVNFNCILRTLELESRGLTRQYGEVFSTIPTIGFSTYGEAYIGHINQTATMLIFK